MVKNKNLRIACLLFGIGLFVVSLLRLYTAFAQREYFLAHDEAEHLSVIYALMRGERPYLDFIENHPVLFHQFFACINNVIAFKEPIELYWFVKSVIAVHCLIAIFTFLAGCKRLVKNEYGYFYPYIVFVLAISILGVWQNNNTYKSSMDLIWQLRPDWISYCYAIVCVYLHQSILVRVIQRDDEHVGYGKVVLAGFFGGLATAILSKSIYIFLPYAFAILSLSILDFQRTFSTIKQKFKLLVGINIVFLSAGVLTFCLLLVYELHATHVPLEAYFHANFLFNATKHLTVYVNDSLPVSILIALSGLGLIGFMVVSLIVQHTFIEQIKSDDALSFATLAFVILVLVLNVVLPSYSNGLAWGHYFIPSLLAITVVFAVVTDNLLGIVARATETSLSFGAASKKINIRKYQNVLVLLLLIPAFCYVTSQLHEASLNYAYLEEGSVAYKKMYADDSTQFLPDRFLPDDLTYMTFSPGMKPVKAKAWGYYFMLSPDRKAFADMNKFGLGPDLDEYWPELMSKSPPDVILLTNKSDFQDRNYITRRAANGDLSWLWAVMEKNYSCVRYFQLQLFIKNDLSERFAEMGWRKCSAISHKGFFDE